MKSKWTKKYLNKLLNHAQYHNKMAPFPVYDTDWVKDIENKITEMENNHTHDYDEDEVVACKYCDSLHIVYDDYLNNHCMRCGSINDLVIYKNIFEYKRKTNQK